MGDGAVLDFVEAVFEERPLNGSGPDESPPHIILSCKNREAFYHVRLFQKIKSNA